MIITKTPFRISFCGGGSDLPVFYKKYGGCVINAAINKYIYLSIHPYFFSDKTMLKYSKTEIVDNLNAIEHKIFNCVLNKMSVHGVEITSTADIPAGTGLGSSSSFTVGLLHTLYCYLGKFISKDRLADEACHIEIDLLGNPIGKQDQYAAALGGLNYIQFNQDGTVSYEPIITKSETYRRLRENMVLFYLGSTRSANTILDEQRNNVLEGKNIDPLIKLCALTREMKTALENNALDLFGKLLNESWMVKKKLAQNITNDVIEEYYKKAINAGALGGKLLGAGGTGFLLFYCEPEFQEKLKTEIHLPVTDFSFDHTGTSVVYIGDTYWK
jgi:D-glycero-alpha-D-manno-heptose-7-phosphate kinase